MSARGKARNRALDVLFEAEQRSASAFDVLKSRREQTDQIVNPYTLEIVEGVVSHQAAIDEFLETYSQGWTLERMPSVDRIILRIGTGNCSTTTTSRTAWQSAKLWPWPRRSPRTSRRRLSTACWAGCSS